MDSQIRIIVPESSTAGIEHLMLTDFYVDTPNYTPSPDSLTQARPIEWDEDNAILTYRVMCPHCAQGFDFTVADINTAGGKMFISCPECRKE